MVSIRIQDKDGKCTRCGSEYGGSTNTGRTTAIFSSASGCWPPDDPAKVEIMLIGTSTAGSCTMDEFLAELAELVATAEPNQEAIDELKVRCELDTRSYPKAITVSDAEMATLNIKGDIFHPDRNYTVSPSYRLEAVIFGRSACAAMQHPQADRASHQPATDRNGQFAH